MGRKKSQKRRASVARAALVREETPGAGAVPVRGTWGFAPGPELWIWLGVLALVVAVFLILKMFTVNAYAGDEHIYIYQAQLVSEGVAPYSGFAMAHPPLQTLFSALILKLFGYQLTLARLLPVFWCLAGGVVLAVLVRRELGPVASVAACAFYLLSYEPLRASSHYTGVNMTVALLLAALLALRSERIRIGAALCVAAVFTRLYASPCVLVLALGVLLADRRRGLVLIAWGAGLGIATFVAISLWAGFGDMIHNMVLYHAQKTPMSPEALANMRNGVLFHNAPLAALFALSAVALVAGLLSADRQGGRQGALWKRLSSASERVGLGLPLLCAAVAICVLAVLTSMDRVWMYYFIPSFPFAAVAGGWLIARWISGAKQLIRAKGKIAESGLSREAVVGGTVLAGLFVLSYLLCPRLEHNLKYWDKEMKKPPAERVHSYTWRPAKLLPQSLNKLVQATIWNDERTIGDRYSSFSYYLWHESRILDVVDEVVELIERETSASGEIFGDSGTVPLFALLSGRRVAVNEVDTNIQRYRSGNADPRELVQKLDNPQTEMIILRNRFGVSGVAQVKRLVKEKYRLLRSVRTFNGIVFHLFLRNDRATGTPT